MSAMTNIATESTAMIDLSDAQVFPVASGVPCSTAGLIGAGGGGPEAAGIVGGAGAAGSIGGSEAAGIIGG